jgi:hypothetical protein
VSLLFLFFSFFFSLDTHSTLSRCRIRKKGYVSGRWEAEEREEVGERERGIGGGGEEG